MNRLTSREGAFFQNQLRSRNGVVVESNWDGKDEVAMVVIDFANHEVVYILRSCFSVRLSPSTRSQFYKDERTYPVFDNVNFEADERNFVKEKVSRNSKILILENRNGALVVSTRCVLQVNDDGKVIACFTELAGLVEFDEKVVERVITDSVTFNCWLSFTYDSNVNIRDEDYEIQKVKYQLHSIDSVDPQNLAFAFNAPWNAHITRNMDYDRAIGDLPSKELTELFPQLDALYVQDNIVYVPSKPRWDIRLAFMQLGALTNTTKICIQPGMNLTVDVKYSEPIDKFIVYEATKGSAPSMQYENAEDGNLLHTNISPVEKCPGYFHIANGRGLVFDRDGVFGRRYLDARFAVTDAKIAVDVLSLKDDRKYTPLFVADGLTFPQVRASDVIGVQVVGVYVGNNSFHVPTLYYLNVVADPANEVALELGKLYVVTISYFDDSHVYAMATYYNRGFRCRQEKKQCLFWVDITWFRGVSPFVWNENIGAIGITNELESRLENLNPKAAIVCFNDFGSGGQCRAYALGLYRDEDLFRFYNFNDF